MTPRERALAALRHEIPDRVPAYVNNLMEWERHAGYFGVSTPEELLELWGNTIISFQPAYLGKPSPDGLDLWGVQEEMRGTYTDSVPRPLAGAERIADVEAYDWPSADDWDFAGLRERLQTEHVHARMSCRWMPVFSRLCELFGMERALMNLYENPKVVEAALAHLQDYYDRYYERLLATCGDELDIFALGDDFAANTSLLFPAPLWRSHFKPLFARWLSMAKSRGLPTLMHCCGNLTSVLDDLVDIGLDAWETVQTHLPGQDPAHLKRRYGTRLTFVGAIDTTNVLGVAAPGEVSQHVEDQLAILGEGGGYICAPDHTIMAGVPSENVAALYGTCAGFTRPGCTG